MEGTIRLLVEDVKPLGRTLCTEKLWGFPGKTIRFCGDWECPRHPSRGNLFPHGTVSCTVEALHQKLVILVQGPRWRVIAGRKRWCALRGFSRGRRYRAHGSCGGEQPMIRIVSVPRSFAYALGRATRFPGQDGIDDSFSQPVQGREVRRRSVTCWHMRPPATRRPERGRRIGGNVEDWIT